jgi:hypothetical protein
MSATPPTHTKGAVGGRAPLDTPLAQLRDMLMAMVRAILRADLTADGPTHVTTPEPEPAPAPAGAGSD